MSNPTLNKKILCSVATHRGIELPTMMAINNSRFDGVNIVEGIADLALARNLQLTYASNTYYDYVMMIDDDIVFERRHIDNLLKNIRDIPIASPYNILSEDGPVTCLTTRLDGARYNVGFGFMLIPITELKILSNNLQRFRYKEEQYFQFARCGILKGEWQTDDYFFCDLWGGIEIYHQDIGHIKKMVI